MKRNEVILALKNYALGPEKGLNRKVAIEAIRLLSTSQESKKRNSHVYAVETNQKPGKTEIEAIRNWNKMIEEEDVQK